MEVKIENRKIIRTAGANLKRKSKMIDLSQQVTLEKVLGLTVTGDQSLSVDPNSGIVAYPAGCVIVLFNTRKHKQSHIFNTCRKTITSLAFSGDGKHLVTGESGHQPCVRVWDVEDKTQVCEFAGHKFGIQCVAFSPNLKYIVSIGTQHDMLVNVWNWKTNTKVASNKVSSKVSNIVFSKDGSMFITVGNRHVKFWYLDASKSKIKNETMPLMGRSGILGDQKNNYFCGVVAGHGGSIFAITQSGLLCEFNNKRLLDKWVELRTQKATCLAAGTEQIFIGCGDGVVRIFNAKTLHFISTMPRPHYLGVNVSKGLDPSHMVATNNNAKYPDCVAISFDETNKKVTCIYNDHSFYVWDVRDLKKIGKSWSCLYHSTCIWGIDVYPEIQGLKSALPSGSFITCSNDDTIRIWNIDPHMNNDTQFKRNIYSNELLNITYIDSNMGHVCERDSNPSGATDKTDTSYDGKNGVRAVKISPDGQNLASGDRAGNIRIHELHFLEEVQVIEAHDSEVLCLEYSTAKVGPRLLASASRDRLIHVFDIEQNYGLLQTLDDHSSSITAIKFNNYEDQMQMLSCGADKSVLFRTAQQNPDFQFVLNRHLVGKTTLYDMDVDPTHKYVATACQDRNVRIYNVNTGKQKKCYKGAIGDDGTLIKVELDNTGTFIATSCSDKTLSLVDFLTGECLATMFGHSEIATGVKFMNDKKHLISVSGDGCIFIWKLSSELSHMMQSRSEELGQVTNMLQNNVRRGTFAVQNGQVQLDDTDFGPPTKEFLDPPPEFNDPSHPPLDYRFSVGQLPTWAKKQIGTEPGKDSNSSASNNQPRGRWAQRVEDQGITVKSVLDEDKTIQVNWANTERRRFTAEPDQLDDLRRQTMVISGSNIRPSSIPIINDDENNQDDDDDEFFPALSREEIEKRLNADAELPINGTSKITTRGNDLYSRGIPNRRPFNPSEIARSPSSDDEEEEERREVIYYPPNNGSVGTPDSNPSSFQVYAVTKEELREKRRQMKQQKQETAPSMDTSTIKDPDSRSEATVSDEDGNETGDDLLSPGNSTPNTPVSGTGKPFLSPAQGIEDTLLEEPQVNMSPRLSISARFLSRAQQQLKNGDSGQSNEFILGWKGNESLNMDLTPEKDHTSYTTQNHSPPTRLDKKNNSQSNTFDEKVKSKDGKDRRKNRTDLDLNNKSESGNMNSPSRSARLRSKGRASTPTYSKSEWSLSQIGREKENESVSLVISPGDDTNGKQAYRRMHSYQMPTASSEAKLSRAVSDKNLNKELSEITNLANGGMSKTTSQSILGNSEVKTKPRRLKGRLGSSSRQTWVSSPNLALIDSSESQDNNNLLKWGTKEVDVSNSLASKGDIRGSQDSLSSIESLPTDDGKPKVGSVASMVKAFSKGKSKTSKEENRELPKDPSSTLPRSKRKTTSDLTLAQAKEILKGNSGILNSTDEGITSIDLNSTGTKSPSKPSKVKERDGDKTLVSESNPTPPRRRTRRERAKSEIFPSGITPEMVFGRPIGEPKTEASEGIADPALKGMLSNLRRSRENLLTELTKSREELNTIVTDKSPRRRSVSRSRENLSKLSLSRSTDNLTNLSDIGKWSTSSPSLNNGKMALRKRHSTDRSSMKSGQDTSDGEFSQAETVSSISENHESPRTSTRSGRERVVKVSQRLKKTDLDSSSDSLPSAGGRLQSTSFNPKQTSSPQTEKQEPKYNPDVENVNPIPSPRTRRKSSLPVDDLTLCAEVVAEFKKSYEKAMELYRKVQNENKTNVRSQQVGKMLRETFTETKRSISQNMRTEKERLPKSDITDLTSAEHESTHLEYVPPPAEFSNNTTVASSRGNISKHSPLERTQPHVDKPSPHAGVSQASVPTIGAVPPLGSLPPGTDPAQAQMFQPMLQQFQQQMNEQFMKMMQQQFLSNQNQSPK